MAKYSIVATDENITYTIEFAGRIFNDIWEIEKEVHGFRKLGIYTKQDEFLEEKLIRFIQSKDENFRSEDPVLYGMIACMRFQHEQMHSEFIIRLNAYEKKFMEKQNVKPRVDDDLPKSIPITLVTETFGGLTIKKEEL